jgi:hypothetical protein
VLDVDLFSIGKIQAIDASTSFDSYQVMASLLLLFHDDFCDDKFSGVKNA